MLCGKERKDFSEISLAFIAYIVLGMAPPVVSSSFAAF